MLPLDTKASGRCPAVFATGYLEDHVRKRVIDAGALGHFMTLRDDDALLSCIERAFRTAA